MFIRRTKEKRQRHKTKRQCSGTARHCTTHDTARMQASLCILFELNTGVEWVPMILMLVSCELPRPLPPRGLGLEPPPGLLFLQGKYRSGLALALGNSVQHCFINTRAR